jgi:hypothetical protein
MQSWGEMLMDEELQRKADWTSLEIAKLTVPIIASIVLAVVGFQISKQLATFETTIKRDEKMIDSLVQKRLVLYDKIGRKLNQMFGYYMYVGKWKELSPEDIVGDKRELDEIIYTYQPFFSNEFVDKYKELEKQMFQPFNGWGQDARLRTEVTHRKEFYLPANSEKKWDEKWDARFTKEDNAETIRQSYSALISILPVELGIPELSKQGIRPISTDQVAKSNRPPK